MASTPSYVELPLAAQTAFAGVDDSARQADLRRSVADVPGGFAKKTVAGRAYWYHQVKLPGGKLQQTYVGPDDEATCSLLARHADPSAKLAQQHLTRLARAAIELGCAEIPLKHARVIERLAHSGLFSAGAILAGTHVFLAYQNIFGLRWTAGAATLDLDFAHAGRNLSVALPENLRVDARAAIESLEQGFVPNLSQTSYRKADEPDFDLDFLTTRGRAGDAPVFVERLNLSMQPLRFMELSLEDPMRATLLSRNGPIVVNMPRPERYALHKLLVYGERAQAQRTKANKDLLQATALVDYLLEHDEAALAQMWLDVRSRGPGWLRRLDQGYKAMCKAAPQLDIAQRMEAVLKAQ